MLALAASVQRQQARATRDGAVFTTTAVAARRRSVTGQLVRVLVELFTGLGSWHIPDRDRYTGHAVPLVRGAQRALADVVSAAISEDASAVAGRPIPPPSIPTGDITDLRGVPTEVVYQRPFVEVYTALRDGRALADAVDLGANRVREIADMDMQQTYAHANHTALNALPAGARPLGWRRVLVGEKNCALCVVASTQRYRVEDLNPIHPACVPPPTLVRARRILGGTRRRYTGELVTLATATGDQIAITPNHPVLADRGWVPAGDVRPGDYLARGRDGKRVVGDGPHEGDTPVLAEDVWRSLTVMFGFARVPLAAEDFHGDGANSEVDVVRADGYFSTVGDAQQVQRVRESAFMGGKSRRVEFAGAGTAATLVPSGRPAAHGVVGGGGLMGAFLGGHLCRAHEAGVRAAASRDAVVPEPPSDNAAGDPITVGDDVLGGVPVDVVDAQLFRRVTDISRIGFSGHVLNFQTDSASYEANGFIVHNCDCTVAPLYTASDLVIDPELLEQVHDAVEALTGSTDRGAREPDYRKILTRRHGELGDLLAYPLDQFTGPDDIPT